MYYYNRALVKAKLDKLEDAIADYVKAIEFLTEARYMYQAKFNKGVCLRRLGRLDESIEDLKNAVQLQGDKASAHNNLGLSYFEKEDFEEAISEFSKAISIEPHPFHLNNRGLAYYHLGLYDEAKTDYDEAIKKNPDDSLVFFNRGNVFLNKLQFDEAHKDFDTAISKEPKNPKFWHAKGLAYETKAI
jgi:tetratricopeptide (TPR) repeat protein